MTNIMVNIRNFFDSLDSRTFYLYIGGFLGLILLINAALIINFYYRLSGLNEQIAMTDQDRTSAKRILTQYARVKKHRDEVDKLLSEDPEFKIVGYFNKVRANLGLSSDNIIQIAPLTPVDQAGKYIETGLRVQLTNMDMKQLCELLDFIDHDRRIYTKELEIAKSKKNKRVLDITLTIATLEPKTAEH